MPIQRYCNGPSERMKFVRSMKNVPNIVFFILFGWQFKGQFISWLMHLTLVSINDNVDLDTWHNHNTIILCIYYLYCIGVCIINNNHLPMNFNIILLSCRFECAPQNPYNFFNTFAFIFSSII